MGWSLDQLRDLDADEYDELLKWSSEKREPDGEGSMDVDAYLESKDARGRAGAEDESDDGG